MASRWVKMLSAAIECLLLTVVFCDAFPTEDLSVIDLTHDHGPNTIYWPGNPEFNFTILSRGLAQAGFWYENNKFQTAEHGGTHVDAPAHFFKDRQRQHEIPMASFIGPGVVINVTSQADENPDYRVTLNDTMRWESKHGRIPKGAVVIMNSGWHKKYPNKTLVFGTNETDNPSTFHFPGWHEDTADWLVYNRSVNVVAVDTPSTDYGQSTTYPTHLVLSNENIPGAENVANLDELPESGCIVYVSTMKLYEGSGAPARIFATCTNAAMTSTGSATIQYHSPALHVLLLTSVSFILM